MPPGAKKVSRHREIKETRQVRDGETCSDVRVESNGRTTTRRECKTRYREEPIYADRCSYTADRWQPTRTESVKGPRSEEPRWPPVKIETPGHGLGAEREGPRKERFVVVVRDVKGVETVCDLERAHWAALPTEGGLEGDVAALTGKVECASLKSP